jgi:aminopeptidase N
LGDDVFFKGLQKYYTEFQNRTVLTNDFKKAMESVSKKDLDLFYQQWLWLPGHPVLDVNWFQKTNSLKISVIQVQPDYLFSFPLQMKIIYENGDSEEKIIQINTKKNDFLISVNANINEIKLDPNTKLLFENNSFNNFALD